MTETQTWNGYPPEPEKIGLHILHDPEHKNTWGMNWSPTHQYWFSFGISNALPPGECASRGWTYLGPYTPGPNWQAAMQRARELCFEQANIFNSQYKRGHVDRQMGAIACVDAIDTARGVGISGRDYRAKPSKPNNVAYEKGWQAGRDQAVAWLEKRASEEHSDASCGCETSAGMARAFDEAVDAIQFLPPPEGSKPGQEIPASNASVSDAEPGPKSKHDQELAAFEALADEWDEYFNHCAWQLRAVIDLARGGV